MTPSAVTPAARRARAAGQAMAKQPSAGPSPKAIAGRAAANAARAAAAASPPIIARAAGAGGTAGPAARKSGHRGSVGRQSAPRAPRRVSGPASRLVRGRLITSPQRSGGVAPADAPRPAERTTRPRPAERTTRPRPTERTTRPRIARREPLAARAAAYVRALPDHSLLDRIIRGRAWIPLVGVLLAGIVAMQVEVLKLGASIGRSIERGTALQSRNEILRASVASLADDARIEQRATAMGMVMPAPAEVKFLAASGGNDVQRAINNIHSPDAAAFTAQLQAAILASGATASGAAVTATPATTAAGTVPASATAAQSTPSTGSSATTTSTTSSPPIAPAQIGATAGQGAGSTPASTPTATPTTATPTTPTTTSSVPVQTGAAATPVGAGAPTSGQTGSSGGAATPTGG